MSDTLSARNQRYSGCGHSSQRPGILSRCCKRGDAGGHGGQNEPVIRAAAEAKVTLRRIMIAVICHFCSSVRVLVCFLQPHSQSHASPPLSILHSWIWERWSMAADMGEPDPWAFQQHSMCATDIVTPLPPPTSAHDILAFMPFVPFKAPKRGNELSALCLTNILPL